MFLRRMRSMNESGSLGGGGEVEIGYLQYISATSFILAAESFVFFDKYGNCIFSNECTIDSINGSSPVNGGIFLKISYITPLLQTHYTPANTP